MKGRHTGLIIGIVVGIIAFVSFGAFFGGAGSTNPLLSIIGLILTLPILIVGNIIALILTPFGISGVGNIPGGLFVSVIAGAISYPLIGYIIGRLVEKN